MNHHEYTTARSRNLVTLMVLGMGHVELRATFTQLSTRHSALDYRAQLNAMSELIDQLRGRSNKRGKQYTYTTR